LLLAGHLPLEAFTHKALGVDTQPLMGHCGSQGCRGFGPSTPASITQASVSFRSPMAATPRSGLAKSRCFSSPAWPGFGLSKARRSSSAGCHAGYSSHAHSRSNSWVAERVHDAKIGVSESAQESKEWLRSKQAEMVKVFRPPSQLTVGWQGVHLVPIWIYYLCVVSLLASLVMLVGAFAGGAPSDSCADSDAFLETAVRYAHITLMSVFMFAAGALLAVEHPVRWMMLRIL